jgi:L-alanine-DL-glutamate epimerase-like enolase superfamily enzyme
MTFTIQSFQFHVLPMHTRFPFKYGIASMSALPHLFVTVNLVVDGKAVCGLASEGLPPKWFTKNPDTLFEVDLAEMIAVIQNASRIARLAAEKPTGFFAWWQNLYAEQTNWAQVKAVPPLLANLGVSLIERAVLDGLCKALGQPLHAVLQSDVLGIDLGAVREELRGMRVSDVIAPQPLSRVFVRHTIGLGDPLTAADGVLNDGLPYTLEENIRTYGLRYFKLKVCGKPETDLPRLREITRILTANCPDGFHATLDGNEQFYDLASFRDFYATLSADAALAPLFQHLLLIEQPLHRSKALNEDVADTLRSWTDGPGMIIDESDGSLADLPRALDLGYRGTSHKNCKGIVKGLANAALLKKRAAVIPGGPLLSGEDLANVGPVALLQDLSVMALLGITHVERNGHHYFRGLSMHSPATQNALIERHTDLYQRHTEGFATLRIENGSLDLQSVNAAPFGCGITLDVTQFEPLNDWIKRGGMGEL